MKPTIVEQNAFEVTGIEARTNNAKEAGPEGVIGKQWERFMRDGLQQQIPDKADQNIYAVYTDYASDANGDYTFVLGAKVRSSPDRLIPTGMVVKKIPAGRYAVFTSERGPVQKIVVETWRRIWEYYQSPRNSQRAYRADLRFTTSGRPTRARRKWTSMWA